MIVGFSYTKVKDLISNFLLRTRNELLPVKEEVTLITNQDTTLINNIFKDFSYNTVSTRHFKDGTFYLVVAMNGSELFIQIVLDSKVCPEEKFQVKRLVDLHEFLDANFKEDDFLALLDAETEVK